MEFSTQKIPYYDSDVENYEHVHVLKDVSEDKSIEQQLISNSDKNIDLMILEYDVQWRSVEHLSRWQSYQMRRTLRKPSQVSNVFQSDQLMILVDAKLSKSQVDVCARLAENKSLRLYSAFWNMLEQCKQNHYEGWGLCWSASEWWLIYCHKGQIKTIQDLKVAEPNTSQLVNWWQQVKQTVHAHAFEKRSVLTLFEQPWNSSQQKTLDSFLRLVSFDEVNTFTSKHLDKRSCFYVYPWKLPVPIIGSKLNRMLILGVTCAMIILNAWLWQLLAESKAELTQWQEQIEIQQPLYEELSHLKRLQAQNQFLERWRKQSVMLSSSFNAISMSLVKSPQWQLKQLHLVYAQKLKRSEFRLRLELDPAYYAKGFVIRNDHQQTLIRDFKQNPWIKLDAFDLLKPMNPYALSELNTSSNELVLKGAIKNAL
jgi:hypothetical protein